MGENGVVGPVAFVKDGGEVLGLTGAGRGSQWCIWGYIFVFGFKMGGSTIFGPAQAGTEAKVGKASAKDEPLSGALKGRASLLRLVSSAEKVQEGHVLLVRESRGGDNFSGSVGRRGQGMASDEEPRVKLPHVPDILFLHDGSSEHFPVDSLSSRVAITDDALVVETNRLTGVLPSPWVLKALVVSC